MHRFHSQTDSFSMLFPVPSHQKTFYDESEYDMYYPHASSSSPSSSVDCTLSLGTPSTRLSDDEDKRFAGGHDQRRAQGSSCVSNFCWDFLPNKPTPHRSGRTTGGANNSGNDPLFARRCANCDTTSTPLWRNGPRGPKSLCNACGIRFKKEERRASAANASMNNGGIAMGGMEQQHMMSNNSWYHNSQTQKAPSFSSSIGNEFRFIEDENGNSDSGIPFLSWTLNRPTSLVHDFTR